VIAVTRVIVEELAVGMGAKTRKFVDKSAEAKTCGEWFVKLHEITE
jgi:hypothetical protein